MLCTVTDFEFTDGSVQTCNSQTSSLRDTLVGLCSDSCACASIVTFAKLTALKAWTLLYQTGRPDIVWSNDSLAIFVLSVKHACKAELLMMESCDWAFYVP